MRESLWLKWEFVGLAEDEQQEKIARDGLPYENWILHGASLWLLWLFQRYEHIPVLFLCLGVLIHFIRFSTPLTTSTVQQPTSLLMISTAFRSSKG
ncbi:uncharacterized protein BP01DRAFT_135294 [Aspergillus saccharolyticus JOP 1030-1]|uniref:Uncharacterized protein n=1 Tax=Aspergillus saccharolyticus JOP 1030-1 TaxID=1450539 RepID=A0A318Z5N1_9EURO|nr:hypothetical protein BP01DRAFT_135294 [Aspergillus saccharolyticus JOP 1030-1]PYH42409.1 hypothetical protein BP01DRAFT_135294 [Aspergillus saccharolyticus JOP 1030-1]